MTGKPRRAPGTNGTGPAAPGGAQAALPAGELDTIAVTAANLRDVAAWLTARGYAVRKRQTDEQVLSAFHPAYSDRHAVRPGDILICDQATGRVWRG